MSAVFDDAADRVEQYGIGQPLRRLEDARFLTGRGRFLEDIVVPDVAHAVFVRAEHAHADIVSIDLDAARAQPGVLGVFDGRYCAARGLGGVPTRTPAVNSSGAPVAKPHWPALAVDRVRYLGEAVVMVVADSDAAARAGAERVVIEYRPLAAVTDAAAALEPGAPTIWDDQPDNVCVEFETGDAAAVDAAFARADHVVTLQLNNNRVTPLPLENRGALAIWGDGDGRHTLYCTTQNVHANRNQIAEDMLGIERDRLRLIAPDVGGGFGAKNPLYPEYALVLFAARELGRPVRWVNGRSESMASDSHGRDQRSTVSLALNRDGRFQALKVISVGNLGPYLLSVGPFTPTGGSARTQGGPYKIPALYFHARAAFSNAAPTDPYRGAGRPEASYQIDRVIDYAAHTLGMDPLTLRRVNALSAADMPYTMGSGAKIDSGDCREVLERTVKLADWDGFETRRRASRERGLLRGIGIGFYLECSGGGPKEHASVSVNADATLTLAVGSQSTGMGHETALPQLLAHRLGIDIARIRFVQGDTAATPFGGGHGGSRGMEMGGTVTVSAAAAFIERATAFAAQRLEAAAEDLDFADGRFRVQGTDRAITMGQVIDFAARADAAALPAELADGLSAASDYERVGITFPYGCQICEVEVDADTGRVSVERFSIVDDFGVVINPLTAAGQVMGGVAQGVGQALLEEIRYDADGQLLTGSLMDYGLPRADDLCDYQIDFFLDTPTAHNPLGVKGSGEAGCCGALPAVVNAVVDALAERGVRHIDMPLTAPKVWRAANAAAGDAPD